MRQFIEVKVPQIFPNQQERFVSNLVIKFQCMFVYAWFASDFVSFIYLFFCKIQEENEGSIFYIK